MQEIVSGGVYEGTGAISVREVDIVTDEYVAWCTPNTLPFVRRDGSVLHQPHGTCRLKTFASWAKRRVDTPLNGDSRE